MIFVTLSTFAEYDREPLHMLERSGVPFRIHDTGKRVTPPELLALGSDATAVIAGVEPYDRATLEAMPSLKCISRVGVGVDAIDLATARERGVAVVNTPDPPTAAVAELALTMMLALCRNVPRQSKEAAAGRWTRLEAHLLGSRRVGVIGLGRIGRRVATLARAFGAEVWGADPEIDAAWCGANGVRTASLEEMLPGCDIVSIHAARSAGAPLMFGEAELARMRKGAILINLGRGEMVDEHALRAALTSGYLFGAGLDVYPKEPYSGALTSLDNVLLTPHSATLTVETRADMEREAVRKALAVLDGSLPAADRII